MSRQRADARRAESEAGRAALLLAHDAIDAITERLDAALTLNLDMKDMALRGVRTGELISTMRDYDIGRVPSEMQPDFNRMRSCAVAVNERMADIYASEKTPDYSGKLRSRSERKGRLLSAVKQRNEAVNYFGRLQKIATGKYKVAAFPLLETPKITEYQ